MKNINRIFNYAAVVASACLFISCVINPPAWYKEGYNKFDTENALAQCEYDVSMQKIPDEKYASTVKNCMIRQGFRYLDNPPNYPKESTYSISTPAQNIPTTETKQNSPEEKTTSSNQQDNTNENSSNESGEKEWWK